MLRLTAGLPGHDKMLIDLYVLRSEALGALGRHAEALALAGEPDVNDYWADVQRVNVVCAAIELARGDAGRALDRLRVVVRSTADDRRRLALWMHVASLLRSPSIGSGTTTARRCCSGSPPPNEPGSGSPCGRRTNRSSTPRRRHAAPGSARPASTSWLGRSGGAVAGARGRRRPDAFAELP